MVRLCPCTTSCARTGTVESGFIASPSQPRGDKALLREGMQTERRERRSNGEEKGREGEAERVISRNLTPTLGSVRESCVRGVLRGKHDLYRLVFADCRGLVSPN